MKMAKYIDLIDVTHKNICEKIIIKPSEYHYIIHWLCKHNSSYYRMRNQDLEDIASHIIKQINIDESYDNILKIIKYLMIDLYAKFESVNFYWEHTTQEKYYYHLKNNAILWMVTSSNWTLYESYIQLYHMVNKKMLSVFKINLLAGDVGINHRTHRNDYCVFADTLSIIDEKILRIVRMRKICTLSDFFGNLIIKKGLYFNNYFFVNKSCILLKKNNDGYYEDLAINLLSSQLDETPFLEEYYNTMYQRNRWDNIYFSTEYETYIALKNIFIKLFSGELKNCTIEVAAINDTILKNDFKNELHMIYGSPILRMNGCWITDEDSSHNQNTVRFNIKSVKKNIYSSHMSCNDVKLNVKFYADVIIKNSIYDIIRKFIFKSEIHNYITIDPIQNIILDYDNNLCDFMNN